MTVENCGRSVTIEEPSRIVTSNTDPVYYVAAVGELDKIVAVAGLPSNTVFDEAIAAKIGKLPVLGGPEGALSTEAILGTNADLVIGTENNGGLTFEQLQTVGVPLLVTTGYCRAGGDTAGTDGRVDFTDIQNDIMFYGELFGTEDHAKRSVANIQSRLAGVKNNLKPVTTESTAAALFLSGDTLAAYGNQSMSHTQFGLLGLRNVFAEVADRHFEPTVEEIINRNPDFIEVLT
ncbi:MAG: ABC transporter substrate-binding protein, partial [Pseudonocardiaceae bacterium]